MGVMTCPYRITANALRYYNAGRTRDSGTFSEGQSGLLIAKITRGAAYNCTSRLNGARERDLGSEIRIYPSIDPPDRAFLEKGIRMRRMTSIVQKEH